MHVMYSDVTVECVVVCECHPSVGDPISVSTNSTAITVIIITTTSITHDGTSIASLSICLCTCVLYWTSWLRPSPFFALVALFFYLFVCFSSLSLLMPIVFVFACFTQSQAHWPTLSHSHALALPTSRLLIICVCIF